MDQTPIPEDPIPILFRDDDVNDLYDEPLAQHFSAKWIHQHLVAAAIAVSKTLVHYWDIKRMTPADQKDWQKAMEEEMKSLYDRNVWELADLPKGCKPITGR
jgi:hypothetical protein